MSCGPCAHPSAPRSFADFGGRVTAGPDGREASGKASMSLGQRVGRAEPAIREACAIYGLAPSRQRLMRRFAPLACAFLRAGRTRPGLLLSRTVFPARAPAPGQALVQHPRSLRGARRRAPLPEAPSAEPPAVSISFYTWKNRRNPGREGYFGYRRGFETSGGPCTGAGPCVCSAPPADVADLAERCRSGRTGRSRKPLSAQAFRGFESLSLRHSAF